MGRPRITGRKDLPPGVIVRKRGDKHYYYFQTTGRGSSIRREIPLGKNKEAALTKYKAILKETRDIVPSINKPLFRSWIVGELIKGTRARATRRGMEFDLSEDFIKTLLAESNNRCVLTGIHFDLWHDSQFRARPWAPSIDRIDCSKGYTQDNVRIVATAVNIALNSFGDEVLMKVAEGMVMVKYGMKSTIACRIKKLRNCSAKPSSARKAEGL